MNKTPILLRSLFALAVVVVFVWSMFPMKEADFYQTFLKMTENPQDETVLNLIGKAKDLQKNDKANNPYPSTAIYSAAEQLGQDGTPVNLVKMLKKSITSKMKLKTNNDVISLVRKNASGAIHLGIDLHGGAEFLLKLESTKGDTDNFEKQRDNAIETLRKRLEKANLYECEISPAGADLVSVRVPVVAEDEKAKLEKLILTSAHLEFRLLPDNADELASKVLAEYETWKNSENAVKSISSPELFYRKSYLPAHLEENQMLKDCDLLYTEDDDGKKHYVLVFKKVEMDGKGIKDADVRVNEYNQRLITLSFDGDGTKDFGRVTTENVGRRLAIVLDGKLYSAPTLQCAILGGEAQITGSFSEDEAKSVADALVSGSLPFEISVVSRSDIEPTVGSETIRKSIWSGIIGTVLVMIFMLICYRLSGLVANISLIVNALVMLGAVAAFDITLTLPGIAGVILTIGMAVDANVLIYERIREEIRQGKSVANAVNIGFSRAFSAIFDSNVTTLFVGLILFWQGSGTIKSFAITLAIGIVTTMFTAVFLTRIIFDLILRLAGNRLKKLSMLEFLHNPNINFFKLHRFAFCLSGAFIILSIVLLCVRGKDVLGIDFTGGSQILVKYESKANVTISSNEIEKYLNGQGFDAKASYKTTSSAESDGVKLLEVVIRDKGGKVSDELGNKIINELDKAYPEVEFTKQSQSTLGALIGAEFTKSAIIALVLAMIGMIIYMVCRFQFSYSIAANIALIHDVIVSTGIYLLCGGQITLQVVASMLTLIGYSVNDTIVIFDRQRENITLMNGKTYIDVVNTSLNQTLGRTILTSVSVVLILVAQLIFGGEGIRDFIAVMLIGCIVGCYSSIFISPTITAFWHKKENNIAESAAAQNKKSTAEAK